MNDKELYCKIFKSEKFSKRIRKLISYQDCYIMCLYLKDFRNSGVEDIFIKKMSINHKPENLIELENLLYIERIRRKCKCYILQNYELNSNIIMEACVIHRGI